MGPDRFVDISGARIRYCVAGTGPAALLIHGLGAFVESWDWTVPALRERYTTIAFDYPGFGQSDLIESAFTPDGAAAFTMAFMDALGVRRAVLIGSSLGGAIAAMAAGHTPGRCATLVLVSPAGFDVDVPVATRLATLPGVGELFVEAIRRSPRVGVRNAFVYRDRIPQRLVEATRRYFTEGSAGSSCLKAVRSTVDLRGLRPEIVEHVRAAAARITAPTLIVWGTNDRVVPPAHAAIATRLIAGAQIHLLQGAGHAPYIEDAEAFNTVLMHFLGRVEGPVGARVQL